MVRKKIIINDMFKSILINNYFTFKLKCILKNKFIYLSINYIYDILLNISLFRIKSGPYL